MALHEDLDGEYWCVQVGRDERRQVSKVKEVFDPSSESLLKSKRKKRKTKKQKINVDALTKEEREAYERFQKAKREHKRQQKEEQDRLKREQAEQLQLFRRWVHEGARVWDHVWLSGKRPAISAEFILSNEIRAIANCTPNISCRFKEGGASPQSSSSSLSDEQCAMEVEDGENAAADDFANSLPEDATDVSMSLGESSLNASGDSVSTSSSEETSSSVDGERPVVEYFRVPVDDLTTESILPYLDHSSDFIRDHVAAGRNVLVHCQKGQCRSPTVLIAYAIKHRNMNLHDAYAHLCACNPYVTINDAFKAQLMQFELEKLGKLSLDFFQKRISSSVSFYRPMWATKKKKKNSVTSALEAFKRVSKAAKARRESSEAKANGSVGRKRKRNKQGSANSGAKRRRTKSLSERQLKEVNKPDREEEERERLRKLEAMRSVKFTRKKRDIDQWCVEPRAMEDVVTPELERFLPDSTEIEVNAELDGSYWAQMKLTGRAARAYRRRLADIERKYAELDYPNTDTPVSHRMRVAEEHITPDGDQTGRSAPVRRTLRLESDGTDDREYDGDGTNDDSVEFHRSPFGELPRPALKESNGGFEGDLELSGYDNEEEENNDADDGEDGEEEVDDDDDDEGDDDDDEEEEDEDDGVDGDGFEDYETMDRVFIGWEGVNEFGDVVETKLDGVYWNTISTGARAERLLRRRGLIE